MVFSVLLRGDLGERKVKFRSKRAICGGFEGFGNQPPHPPTFGRNLPKKRFFFFNTELFLPEDIYTMSTA